ncbi:MAG TPA: hypothetical protein ENJ28_07795 [Gammaproteobacteria bacterium]|nr:hypothetical protein [Gammaproteobacteria bacterium]
MPKFETALPWLAGAGLAAAQIKISENCTLTTQGHCSTCGSCAIAVVSLLGWALFKNRKKHPSDIVL